VNRTEVGKQIAKAKGLVQPPVRHEVLFKPD